MIYSQLQIVLYRLWTKLWILYPTLLRQTSSELLDHGSESLTRSKTDVSTASSLNEALDIVASGDGSVDAIIKWFTYEDNTYVIEDLSLEETFQQESDIVVKIQGVNITELTNENILYATLQYQKL